MGFIGQALLTMVYHLLGGITLLELEYGTYLHKLNYTR
ncbi:hypothetical protein IMAU10141_03170 [Lactiplantibacillus plantarum]|nr:hypothetical protein [Lactiplantibacillus plantarum]